MSRIRERLSYANVMATIAVFLLLGGATAFAASQLGKNTVGAKQLKNGSITLQKLSKATQEALKGAAGAVGPAGAPGAKGDPGTPATKLWAVVAANGAILNSSGGVTSTNTGENAKFQIDFPQDVSKCAYSATIGGPSAQAPSLIEAFPRSGKPNSVQVNTWTPAGVDAARAFNVAVFC
jgi:hypothetical protein